LRYCCSQHLRWEAQPFGQRVKLTSDAQLQLEIHFEPSQRVKDEEQENVNVGELWDGVQMSLGKAALQTGSRMQRHSPRRLTTEKEKVSVSCSRSRSSFVLPCSRSRSSFVLPAETGQCTLTSVLPAETGQCTLTSGGWVGLKQCEPCIHGDEGTRIVSRHHGQ